MRRRRVGAVAAVLVIIGGVVVWRLFRNPYEERFFVGAMQEKYATVEEVLESMRRGWKNDSEAARELMDEAYGLRLSRRKRQTQRREGEMPTVDRISYYRSGRLAVANLSDGSAWWFVWRRNRWVFYPETPWLGIVEFIHDF